MPRLGQHLTVTCLLAVVLSGCQMPGREGAVSRSLATCRHLSQQGVAALEREQVQQAETLLGKAVAACPIDPEARRHYAEALWRGGARPEAITQLDEACRLASEDATLRVRLAEMHLLVGQLEPARQSAQQALDLNPKLPAAWAIRGRVMLVGGQPQEALADFHRALGYAPGDRQILLEVAELYRQLSWPQRALATLHSLADTYSPGEEPQQVLYLMGLAYTASRVSRPPRSAGPPRRRSSVGWPRPSCWPAIRRRPRPRPSTPWFFSLGTPPASNCWTACDWPGSRRLCAPPLSDACSRQEGSGDPRRVCHCLT